jgi:glycerophosphoryl diester phosphodiesterase
MATTTRPIIIAHRGLHDVHPENSAPAFRAAERAGLHWSVCVVQQTIDGCPVIIHDETLVRPTNLSGRVDRHRADELMHLRLRDRNGRPGDGHVPVLLGPRCELSGIGGKWLVEIKPPDAPQLVARTAQAMRLMHRAWVLQSFDRLNLDHSRRCAPDVERALLIDNLQNLVFGHFSALHVMHELVDAALVRRVHAQGVKVGAWTVNQPTDIRRMIALGVDRIITDQPLLARSLVPE